QRVLERFRAYAEKRAEQEQLLFEQRASEQRAVEQRAAEERQALEKANRHQACLSRATDNYNASRLAACNRPREKMIKDQEIALSWAFPERYARWRTLSASLRPIARCHGASHLPWTPTWRKRGVAAWRKIGEEDCGKGPIQRVEVALVTAFTMTVLV